MTISARIIEGFRSSLAILIGIDRYGDGVPALRTPVADATELAGILRRDHGFEAEVVSDEGATLDKLRGLLADLGNRVGEDDRVLFYFAGHGIVSRWRAMKDPRAISSHRMRGGTR